MQRLGIGKDDRSFLGKYGYVKPSIERIEEIRNSVPDPLDVMKIQERTQDMSSDIVQDRRVTIVLPEEDSAEIVPVESPVEVRTEDSTKTIPVESPVEETPESKTPVAAVETFVTKLAGGRRNKVERYCMNHVHVVSTAIVVVMAILFIAIAIMMYAMLMERMYRKNKLIQRMESEMIGINKVAEEVQEKQTVENVVEKVQEKASVPVITGDSTTPALTGGACKKNCSKRPRPRLVNKNFDFSGEMAF